MSDEPEPAAAPFDVDRLVAEGRSLRRLACSLLGAGDRVDADARGGDGEAFGLAWSQPELEPP
ncbi:MAG TPA: hypothetical protein VFD82_05090 [Planctomycetota bacterium]|nr:hypothetical protein [Planctomycetota bacterium]